MPVYPYKPDKTIIQLISCNSHSEFHELPESQTGKLWIPGESFVMNEMKVNDYF